MPYIKLFGILTLASLSVSFVLFLFLGNASTNQSVFEITNSGQYQAEDQTPAPAATDNKIKNNNTGNNLTQSLVKDIVQELARKNEDGASLIDGELSLIAPDRIDYENFVQKNRGALTMDKFMPEVDESKIVLTSGNTSQDYTKYLNELYSLLQKSFIVSDKRSQPGNDVLSILKTSSEIVENYDALLAALYALPVPTALKEFHRQEIQLVGAQKNVFAAIAMSNSDPLQSIVALQYLSEIDRRFAEAKQKLKATIEATL